MIAVLVGSLAGAQTPVVHLDGVDGAEAIAVVAERSGLPANQLTSLPLTEVFDTPAALLGPGSLRRCARAPVRLTDIRPEVARARAALLGDDPRSASNKLDLAVVQLGCLSEVVDRSLAAEVFLLRGAHQAAIGNLEGARIEFLTTLAFDPALTWDDALPEAGKPAFEQALAAERALAVQFLPEQAPTGPWLDGAAGAAEVAATLHLVQVATGTGIESAWLVVDGPATVVVPPAFRPTAIEAVGTEPGNDTFGRLLAATVPDFQAAYVVHEGGVWSFLRDEQDLLVNQLAAREVPEPEPLTRKEQRAKRRAERRAERQKR